METVSPPDEDKTVISPYGGGSALGPDVIMAATSPDLGFMIGACGAEIIPGGTAGLYSIYRARDGWGGIAIAGPFFGAPLAVVGLEQIIARGARRVWVVGWCGSLNPDIRIGDLVVPTSALSEEGTSAHYPIGGREPVPDPLMTAAIRSEVEKRSLKSAFGPVWTTDAIYRETASKVVRYGRMGILAVEMEMSALFTVAAFRGISLAGILAVSDELFTLKWRHGFGSRGLKKASQDACLLVLDLASGSSKQGQG